MVNANGSFVVNGITDVELVKILEIKIRHEGHFTFNPQQLQPTGQGRTPQGMITPGGYNNAIFTWTNEQGLEAVHEIIRYLLKKEEHHEAAVNQ